MELEVADDRLIRLSGETVRLPVPDVAGAVAAEIEAPLEFPPLRQAIVPGIRNSPMPLPIRPQPRGHWKLERYTDRHRAGVRSAKAQI